MSVIGFEPFRDPLEFDRLMSMAASGTRAPLGMPMDVYRGQDGAYHVEADLPGVDPDRVEVTVEHSVLTIQAERAPHYGEGDQVIVAERPQGSFTRQLSLGEGVDAEHLTAGYADGVLHVTIPASPKAQARRVEITHAAGGAAPSRGALRSRVRCPLAAPVVARRLKQARHAIAVLSSRGKHLRGHPSPEPPSRHPARPSTLTGRRHASWPPMPRWRRVAFGAGCGRAVLAG